jgi:hypothetical protein
MEAKKKKVGAAGWCFTRFFFLFGQLFHPLQIASAPTQLVKHVP